MIAAADLDPSDPRAYLFLSKAYNSSPNQADDVIQRFRRFAELKPNDARAQYYYAMSLWKGKRAEDQTVNLEQVERLLQNSIALDPKLAEAYLQLGQSLYADRREYAKSIPPYESALKLDPNLSDAHYRLGQDYVHTGQKDHAQEEFAIYQKQRAEHLAEVDKERAEVQQFVYSSPRQPRGPASELGVSVSAHSSFGRNISEHLGRSRRDFLRSAAGLALGSASLTASPFIRGAAAAAKRKIIVITFGGGARDQETFSANGQENIPHLVHDLAPAPPASSPRS